MLDGVGGGRLVRISSDQGSTPLSLSSRERSTKERGSEIPEWIDGYDVTSCTPTPQQEAGAGYRGSLSRVCPNQRPPGSKLQPLRPGE